MLGINTIIKEDIEKRFFAFLEQIHDSENIDLIKLTESQNKQKKADFFLAKRQVIIEIKTLKTDVEQKVETELDKHRNHPNFPIVYGAVDLQQILSKLPNGKEINETIYSKITRSLEQLFRSADKQIISTQQIFEIKNTVNILIILNNVVNILSPEVIVYKISQMITKQNHQDQIRYPNIDCALIINETHYTKINPVLKATPIIILEGPNAKNKKNFDSIVDKLQEDWAIYNNIPLIKHPAKKITEINFESY